MIDLQFKFPTEIRFAWGCLNELPDLVTKYGGTTIFLVAGRHVAADGTAEKIKHSLQPKKVVVFSEVEENPAIATIDEGAESCRKNSCNMIVAIGGGSVLDAAKAMALMQSNKGSIERFLSAKPDKIAAGVPVITIPTTSGTGSEVTPFSVITYPEKKAKPAIYFPEMFPAAALVDPQLTTSMPKAVAASTGLDTLCQAVEGFWSKRANPLTRSLSGKGFLMAMNSVENACLHQDKKSVTDMAAASLITGIQMSHVGNTAIHSLSYPFTVDYGIPHGFACVIFLPSFLRFNKDAIEDMFADILAPLRIASAEALAVRIEEIMEKVGAPLTLKHYGISEERLPSMVRRGITPSTQLNPKPLKEDDMLAICRNLL